MLKNEFQYYLDHQMELVKLYNGKYVLICNQQVVGSFESDLEAVQYGDAHYEAGTFLVQKCSEGTKDYTQTFHSRVCFA